jgi:hypothetical protein
MQNKRMRQLIFSTARLAGTVAVAISVLSLVACHSRQNNPKQIRHFAELKTATGTVFIDPFPVERVMSVTAGNTSTQYCSYKVGFEGKHNSDKEQAKAWQKYVDYDMDKDWVLVINNDSIPVAYNQPVVKHSPTLTESVLVFEIPGGQSPLKMVYKDGFNYTGDKTFLLKSKTE